MCSFLTYSCRCTAETNTCCKTTILQLKKKIIKIKRTQVKLENPASTLHTAKREKSAPLGQCESAAFVRVASVPAVPAGEEMSLQLGLSQEGELEISQLFMDAAECST